MLFKLFWILFWGQQKAATYFEDCSDKYKNMHWLPVLSCFALEVGSADRDGIFKIHDLIREHIE